jgi:hypothetical protein
MENKPLKSLKNADWPEEERGSSIEVGAALGAGAKGDRELNCFLGRRGVCSTSLTKGTLGDNLNQSHDVWSISTRAVVEDGNVPNLFKNEIKGIELGLLSDGLEQIPLKLRHLRGITLSRCQCLPNDPVKDNQLRLEIGDGGSL